MIETFIVAEFIVAERVAEKITSLGYVKDKKGVIPPKEVMKKI